jgi:signal transduction histidine kinase/DNA-binding response OmpR family regulator
MRRLLALTLQHDQDVVTARQRAVHIGQLLGFDLSEQTRLATAVSEIVRNAFAYGKHGSVTFSVDADSRPQRLVVRVADAGPGIQRLGDVLAGRYRSTTGMGLGIAGARRLVDRFSIDSGPAGTVVVLEKDLSPRHELVTAERARQLTEAVASRRPSGLVEEFQQQNQALIRALDELQRKQQELERLNRELEDTNRGVVALYAELDEKADHLRRADELKSRFLSNMTHEFRTPVNAIIGLSNLLLEERREEERQPEPEVVYIRQAAEQLSGLVNDLLDLAKVEAGKTDVRPTEFQVQTLFGALRGMLRPLLLNQSVSLVFDHPDDLPPLVTDEAKLSQILRNLISNALKFTERGEVRISAEPPAPDGTIRLTVADTGVGIAPGDQERIFDEFIQLDHGLQRQVHGTGLGLPLSRRLAGLLGGTLTVSSQPGMGSTFSLVLPMRYAAPTPETRAVDWTPDPGRLPLLVVDDAPDAQYMYEKILRNSAYQICPAYSVREAELALERMTPAAVLLDVVLQGQQAWDLLLRVKRTERTSRTAVVVISSASEEAKALALGADAYVSKPVDRRTLLETLTTVQARASRPVRTLVIDDEEVARFLLRQALPAPAFDVVEADNGENGFVRAVQDRPDVILLDLVMPDTPGEAILERLRTETATRQIPVVIVTSKALDQAGRERLLRDAAAIVAKNEISRGTLGDVVRAAAGRRLGPERAHG